VPVVLWHVFQFILVANIFNYKKAIMQNQSPDKKDQIKNTFNLSNTPPGEDGGDDNITNEELQLLDSAGQDEEDLQVENAGLDNTDEDGELLNENTTGDSLAGSELDVPGSEDDDEDEETGSEDEENNAYSLGADKKD